MEKILKFLATFTEGKLNGLIAFKRINGHGDFNGEVWQVKNARKLREDAMRERLGREFAHLDEARKAGL